MEKTDKKTKEKYTVKNKPKNAHDGHRQRLKKRYLEEGLYGFEEHQALELLLFYCYPRIDTNTIAHEFLQQYGSLSNLFEANATDLIRTLKVTENTAVLLTLIPHLSQKYMSSKLSEKLRLANLYDAGNYCLTLFATRKYETFIILCLDTNKRLLSTNIISEGTIDEAHVYPRKVVENAIRYQANSVILTHNHPGGTMAPSFSDIEITKRISEVLSTIGIAVSDHIIVCGNEYYSFAKENLIER